MIALDVAGRVGPSALHKHMWERPRLLAGVLEHHLVILPQPCSRIWAVDQSHPTLLGSGVSWQCLVFWLDLVSELAKDRKWMVKEVLSFFSPIPLAPKAVILTQQEMEEV